MMVFAHKSAGAPAWIDTTNHRFIAYFNKLICKSK